MEVEFAVFCTGIIKRFATIDILNAGIHGLIVDQFPGSASVVLAYGLRIKPEESGRSYTASAQCWDMDGKIITEIDSTEYPVPKIYETTVIASAVDFGSFVFPIDGEYEFRFYLDNELVINKVFPVVWAGDRE